MAQSGQMLRPSHSYSERLRMWAQEMTHLLYLILLIDCTKAGPAHRRLVDCLRTTESSRSREAPGVVVYEPHRPRHASRDPCIGFISRHWLNVSGRGTCTLWWWPCRVLCLSYLPPRPLCCPLGRYSPQNQD